MAVKLEEVETLQDLVGELGVRNSRLGVEASRDGVFLQHGSDAVVLSDLAQEVDCRHWRRPVEVVDQSCRVRPAEVKVLRDLLPEVADPLGDGLSVVERALSRWFGVTDQTGGTTDEPERRVPLELNAAKQKELNKIAKVEAGGCRVEPAVIGDRSAFEQRLERV